jgi:hypothetical protein
LFARFWPFWLAHGESGTVTLTDRCALVDVLFSAGRARKRILAMLGARACGSHVAAAATYWSIGRRIVVEEQHGAREAGYGGELIDHLAAVATPLVRNSLLSAV